MVILGNYGIHTIRLGLLGVHSRSGLDSWQWWVMEWLTKMLGWD